MRTITLLFAWLSLSASALSQNLVAYYPFNGNANDQSGNAINATYIGSGVTLTTDRFGNANNAYNFDGATGSYMRMPADLLPTTNRTISLWFNVPYVINSPGILGYGGNGCGTTLLMGLNLLGSGQYYVQGHCGNNGAGYTYPTAPVNSWYHWVLTINGSAQKIYVNGQLKSTDNTFGGSTAVSGKDFSLGVITSTSGTAPYTDPNVGYLTGKLDDVRIYDAALSDAQVLSLYNDESGTPIAYYPFNGNANDESGNGNHGTVNGATLTMDRFGNANKAYAFDGSSNYINVPDAATIRPGLEISLSAWVKRTRFGIDIITEKGGDWTGGTCNYGMGLHTVNNNMFYFFFNGGWRGTDGVSDLNWHHYVVAAKNGDANPVLYIDGQPKSIGYSSGPGTIVMNNSAHDLHIGAQVAGGHYGANWIDDIRIYNRILSDAEVAALFSGFALPVTLSDFQARKINTTTAQLTWQTATEINNKGFEVQRSFDGNYYADVQFVNGAGNSNDIKDYSITDVPGRTGRVFYRLKQIDFDGNSKLSNIVSVLFGRQDIIKVYPNPAQQQVTVEGIDNYGKVQVLDATGKLVKEQYSNGHYQISINLNGLKSGIYLLRLVNEKESQTAKLIISN